MLSINFKKKNAILISFLSALLAFTMFMVPACNSDNGTTTGNNTDIIPEIPYIPVAPVDVFNPIEPDTTWVDGAVTIDIFSFNDFHGTMDSTASTSNPGAARFTAIVKHLMAQGSAHSMLLAAGDNYQGSAMSNYFYGEPVSKMMKELGVKYSVVGNHEWDWGDEHFEKFMEDGNIAFITANIFLKGTDKRPDFCHPYVIANRAGRRIGIVGLTTVETPSLVSANNVAKYEFREPGQWLKNLVNELRTVQNCDAVIALTHMGASGSSTVSGEAAKLTSPDMGFDAIISGHSHTNVSGTANGISVIQAECNGRRLGKLSLNFNGRNLVSVTRSMYSNFTGSSNLPVNEVDPIVKAIYEEYNDQIGPIMNEVIGKFGNAQSVDKNNWANQLVFDYIVRKSKEPGWIQGAGWDDVVLIQNSGGWRSVTVGGPNDNVTVGFMWTLMPFDNEIYLFELRGDHLMNLLSGKTVTGTGNVSTPPVITNAAGSGANWTITSNSQKIDATKYYKVSMNDFMFTGGDNYGVEEQARYINNDKSTLILGVPLRAGMIDQMKWRMANGG